MLDRRTAARPNAKKTKFGGWGLLLMVSCIAQFVVKVSIAQQAEQPVRHRHFHTETQAHALDLVPADIQIQGYDYNETIIDAFRHIEANGLANHPVGQFPNAGNPHHIATQDIVRQVPLEPQRLPEPYYFDLIWDFGITRSATVIDPSAAEYWHGDRHSGWQYDALGGAVQLGLDGNHAHVQPNGSYHYHGWPRGVLDALGWRPDAPSPLVGWAADGYPIYAANSGSNGAFLHSSYQLKSGIRDSGPEGPTGAYDGAFVQDYVYIAGLGELDECNGTMIYSAEFPAGTYAYIITYEFPAYPRCFHGRPDRSFMKKRR